MPPGRNAKKNVSGVQSHVLSERVHDRMVRDISNNLLKIQKQCPATKMGEREAQKLSSDRLGPAKWEPAGLLRRYVVVTGFSFFFFNVSK